MQFGPPVDAPMSPSRVDRQAGRPLPRRCPRPPEARRRAGRAGGDGPGDPPSKRRCPRPPGASKMVVMTADAPTVPNPLQPVDETWQRGLAIVAHPDDLEFGAAAAI